MQGTEKEMDYMSLEGFAAYIRMGIQKRLGKDFEVSERDVLKNNGIVLHGLVIQEKGSNISPTIYLDHFYEEYLYENVSLSQTEQRVIDCYHKNRTKVTFPSEQILDWRAAKKKIACRLINYKDNQKLLEDVPHQKFWDLAIVPYYVIDMREGSCATITVQNCHLEMWGITEMELFSTAAANTPGLFHHEIISMADMLKEMGAEDFWETDIEVPMYVLSNAQRLYGAICITYPNLLSDFASKLGTDLYIIPSSVHETILVPVEAIDSEELSGLVREVNATQLNPEEVLSDHVYQYTRKTNQITM